VIRRQLVNELSDVQKGMLLFVVNEGHSFFIDLDTVCAYKESALQQKLEFIKTRVKKEFLNEYEDLCTIIKRG
jgi:hypothetical protein